MTENVAVNTDVNTDQKDPGMIPEGFVYRDQTSRYLWWVKSIDRITVEMDPTEIQRPDTNMIMMGMTQRREHPGESTHRNILMKKIKNGIPGFSLPDGSAGNNDLNIILNRRYIRWIFPN
jgi:hypothetical protein